MNINTYYEAYKDELLHSFNGSDKIVRTYSQAYQDLFVLTVLDGKRNGTYVEIGSSYPIDYNNTYILESEFGWSGVSFDRDELLNKMFENERKNPIVTCDATSVNYAEEFEKYNLPNRIDYLQVDIEPARQTLAALKAIDHQKYRFNVITFETDVYVGGNQDVVKESREMLQDLGYKLVAYHVANGNNPFEDWYVDPEVVPEERWKPFESHFVECVDLFIKSKE